MSNNNNNFKELIVKDHNSLVLVEKTNYGQEFNHNFIND